MKFEDHFKAQPGEEDNVAATMERLGTIPGEKLFMYALIACVNRLGGEVTLTAAEMRKAARSIVATQIDPYDFTTRVWLEKASDWKGTKLVR